MTKSERAELRDHVRQYMLSGKLDEEAFADLALLYSSLNDPSLNGDSFSRLVKYEGDIPGKGWREVFDQVRA
jgi:hypothetical protein